MKRHVFLTASALACATASAGSISVGRFLAGLPNVQNLGIIDRIESEYAFTYRHPNSAGLNVNLSGASYTNQNRLNAIELSLGKDPLTLTERGLLGEVTVAFALKCFNINPARKADMLAWLSAQNTAVRGASRAFGPLELEYQHGAEANAIVTLRRNGVPGQAPWINFCTP
ncbi:hypothetical protein [Deinococcus maricopensis]|uniref:Uncharacterized protein n=1 Tax=Deinococcus maricopensis (strain DSM 21211 / LMG 22137 / NRRL B-23946 / LB-34) TaxID=709986 RepID=E8U9W8_DEIML|nr:hypothetical protein [Deinococcus maricopensis]ADV67857.1 hypothetical protein Deima_2218 [Deinococcus maricopensis DSM 21211]